MRSSSMARAFAIWIRSASSSAFERARVISMRELDCSASISALWRAF
jgi:hypothetical protein